MTLDNVARCALSRRPPELLQFLRGLGFADAYIGCLVSRTRLSAAYRREFAALLEGPPSTVVT